MMREDLRDVLTAKLGREGATFAMALFDCYEREQWRPCSTPPDSARDVLVRDADGSTRVGAYSCGRWRVDGVKGSFSVMDGSCWCELPPGPGEGE